MKQTLKLHDLTFDVHAEESRLAIYAKPDEADWRLEVQTIPGKKGWAPRLYAQGISSLKDCRVANDECISWSESDESEFQLYVVDHLPVSVGHLELSRINSPHVEIRGHGKADIGWNRKYGFDLDFQMECSIPFSEIEVDAKDEAEGRAILSRYMDTDKLIYVGWDYVAEFRWDA